MPAPEARAFETRDQLEHWLESNHASQRELWVRIFKKGSGRPSVDWNDCVVAAIAWGWIDGQKRSLDEASFLQRLTPRRAGSNWSRRNLEHAERLIAEGRMQASGLVHVEAARKDGRWQSAYAGSAAMVMPDDLLAALREDDAARGSFEKLDRGALFAIYLRLQTARRPETRAKRIRDLMDRLARGEAPR